MDGYSCLTLLSAVCVCSWRECRRHKKGKRKEQNDNYETDREKKEKVGVVCKQKVVGNKGAEGSQEQKKDFPSRSISPALLGKN